MTITSCLRALAHFSLKEAPLTSWDGPESELPSLLQHVSRRPRVLVGRKSDTLWHSAAEKGQLQLLQTLVAYVEDNWMEVGALALPWRKRSDLSQQEVLGAVLDNKCPTGQTPLMNACYTGQPEIVRFLLRKGANPWVGDLAGGRTALHYAAMMGNYACIEALMANIPSALSEQNSIRYVDAPSVSGFTPLHYAVAAGRVQCVKALLSYGANFNMCNTLKSYELQLDCHKRSTPLHVAALMGRVDIAVEILKNYDARVAQSTGQSAVVDPRLVMDKQQRLPCQIAATARHAQLAQLLHPDYDLDVLCGREPAKASNLQALCSAALLQHLLASLDAAAAAVVPAPQQLPSTDGDAGAAGAASPSSAATAAASFDDEDNTCGVCFEACPLVAIKGCGHRLCQTCAQHVLQQVTTTRKPVPCPFCRRGIRSFTA